MASRLTVTCHTDPACPRSWGWEPALRRLEVEFDALAVAGGEPLADPAGWRAAMLAGGAVPRPERPSIAEALARWPRLATVEVAAAWELPCAAAAAARWRGVTELHVAVTRTPGGELWSACG